MADVYATIAMAKLVKAAQPRLFEYLLSHRSKQKLMTLIDVPQMKPLVHISGYVRCLARQYKLGGTAGVASGQP